MGGKEIQHEREAYRRTDRWRMDGKKNGQKDGRTERRMDRKKDRHVERRTETETETEKRKETMREEAFAEIGYVKYALNSSLEIVSCNARCISKIHTM